MYLFILVFTTTTSIYILNPVLRGPGCVQDTIVEVPPYPYSIADDIEGRWSVIK
jgi:hypothetical protein